MEDERAMAAAAAAPDVAAATLLLVERSMAGKKGTASGWGAAPRCWGLTSCGGIRSEGGALPWSRCSAPQ
jgi:hypothetical protein